MSQLIPSCCAGWFLILRGLFQFNTQVTRDPDVALPHPQAGQACVHTADPRDISTDCGPALREGLGI